MFWLWFLVGACIAGCIVERRSSYPVYFVGIKNGFYCTLIGVVVALLISIFLSLFPNLYEYKQKYEYTIVPVAGYSSIVDMYSNGNVFVEFVATNSNSQTLYHEVLPYNSYKINLQETEVNDTAKAIYYAPYYKNPILNKIFLCPVDSKYDIVVPAGSVNYKYPTNIS